MLALSYHRGVSFRRHTHVIIRRHTFQHRHLGNGKVFGRHVIV